MDDRHPRRRALLGVAAVATVTAATGCASGASRDGDSGTDKSPKPHRAPGGNDPVEGAGPADDSADVRSPKDAWRYVHFADGYDSSYLALAASARDNVWVLGSRGLTGEGERSRLFLERYDGRAWRSHPLPDGAPSGRSPVALGTTGPDNVWLAVGGGRSIYRWNGTKWQALPKPPTSGDTAMAPSEGTWLATAGPDHAWVCAGGRALYWNGSSWRDTELPFDARSVAAAPAQGPGSGKGSGSGRGSGGEPLAWVVGSRDTECQADECYPQPASARWSGGSWKTTDTPSFRFSDPLPPEASAILETVSLAEDHKRAWALGDHSFNHGEVDEEPDDDGPIVLEWDGESWKKRRLPKLSRALDAGTTVADGAGGVLLDSDNRLTGAGKLQKLAQPPDIAGPGGRTPKPRRGRDSAQNMNCEASCLVPGTRTVLAVGAVEFDSDTPETPRRPMVARYDADQRS